MATFGSTLPAGIINPERVSRVRVWPVSQTDGPLALVGETHGVVVVAGTGALVGGRTRQGHTLTLDGLGPILGDFGSGYAIGLQALRTAAQAAMQPGHHASLKERVFAACDLLMQDALGHSSEVRRDPAEAAAPREPQATPVGDRERLQRLVTFSLTPQDRSALASLAWVANYLRTRPGRLVTC